MKSSRTKDGLEADAPTASPEGFIEAITTLYNAFIERFARRPTEVALPANAGMMNQVLEWLGEHGLRLAPQATPYQRIQVLADLSAAPEEDTIKETQPVDRTFAPESEHISEVSYDTDTHVLTVTFEKGGTYEYYEVDEIFYDGMLALNAESKSGEFFRACIRDSHEYKKVSDNVQVSKPLKAPDIIKPKEKAIPNGLAEGDTINGRDGVYVVVKDPDDIDEWGVAYDKAIAQFESMGLDLSQAKIALPPSEVTDQLIEMCEIADEDLLENYTLGMVYIGVPAAINDRVHA